MKAFFISHGRPVPKGRPRVTRYGTYTPKSTQDYESSIRQAWGSAGAIKFPEHAPLQICVIAYLPIPKRTSKKMRDQIEGKYHIAARGDLDNIVKSVMDALNGYAYQDDAVICSIRAEKHYSCAPRTTVLIADMEDTP